MPDDKIIDFNAAKEPHMHARREKKVDDMRKAFENYLNDGQVKDSRQQRRKKNRDKAKKKP